MGQRLSGEDFNSLFRYFEHTAFRLETRPFYAVAEEQESLEEFLAGEPRPYTEFPFYADWYQQIMKLTAEGKRVQRVRLLDEPPTDYQRWEIWTGSFSAVAGELIQYLDRTRAVELGIPVSHDWWLFDSKKLALMRFDDHGRPLGGEIVTDPSVVEQHCTWRDLAALHSSDPVGSTMTTPATGVTLPN